MRRWIGTAAIVLLILAIFSVVLAQSGHFDLSWHSVDGGGGISNGGDFAIYSSIGQTDTDTMSGGAFTLDGGFLSAPVLPGMKGISVYMPLLSR